MERAAKGRVLVMTIGDVGPEPVEYARQLIRLLELAKYEVNKNPGFATGGGPSAIGLFLAVKNVAAPPQFLNALASALQDADILNPAIPVQPDPAIPSPLKDDEVRIIIGVKL